MPTLYVDGRAYKVTSSGVLKTDLRLRDKKPTYSVSKHGKEAQGAATYAASPETAPVFSDGGLSSWSTVDDMLLQKLIACHLSWNWISIAMGNVPIAELKQRWNLIRNNGPGFSDKIAKVTCPTGRRVRHDSFSGSISSSSSYGTINEESRLRPPKIKSVDYMNEEWTLDEVMLLHEIAAKWERERWLAISSRFADKTGRQVTPEQAKSIIEF